MAVTVEYINAYNLDIKNVYIFDKAIVTTVMHGIISDFLRHKLYRKLSSLSGRASDL